VFNDSQEEGTVDGHSGGDLVVKPVRKHILQQAYQAHFQEWEMVKLYCVVVGFSCLLMVLCVACVPQAQRLTAIRPYIPLVAPVLAWWPPTSNAYVEGLVMPRVWGHNMCAPPFHHTQQRSGGCSLEGRVAGGRCTQKMSLIAPDDDFIPRSWIVSTTPPPGHPSCCW